MKLNKKLIQKDKKLFLHFSFISYRIQYGSDGGGTGRHDDEENYEEVAEVPVHFSHTK